jgi:protein involved in polysaccharide export with SLBB domain
MMQRRPSPLRASSAVIIALLAATSSAWAQPETPPATDAEPAATPAGVPPFGANLFSGNYAAQRENGLNPDYTILPGDRVMVNAWGTVTINDVFGVDTQGNVFVPEIGPIRLQGVRSDQLTDTVRGAIGRVYPGN